MRRILSGLIPLLLVFGASTGAADEAKIREMFGAYVSAINEKNLDALAAAWAEEGTHVDRETGTRTEGRDAIRADLAEAFEVRPTSRLAGRLDRVRLITPTVASIEGETTLIASPDDEPTVSNFTGIVVSTDGQWLIHTIEEMPTPRPATSYEALQQLEWLVGEWVDDGENVRVDTSIRWTTDRAFLLRSFVAQTVEGDMRQGTQIIGWDPRAQKVRSWSFNSDGSFGDGDWTRDGDGWIIKATQTLADGRAASGTYLLDRSDDDSISLQLIGHEIEGEPQPTKDPVRVVRVVEAEPEIPAEEDAESEQ